jgi:5-methylcytosine-specific restriction endonuclease McrA
MSTHMKLIVTQKRIDANKRNGTLGGIVRREKQKTLYDANPCFCTQCSIKLPQDKKNNKFCSRSCAATFNNKVVPKKVATLYTCPFCTNLFKGEGKYCSNECFQQDRRVFLDPTDAKQYKRIKKREVSIRYYQRIKDQTPPDADLPAIKKFYENCPEGYEVDHIIPISKGGPHTLENLQYLTILENRRKSNKLVGP